MMSRRYPCRPAESGADERVHGIHAMHGVFAGSVGGAGIGGQVQLPNPINQRLNAPKPTSDCLNPAEDDVNEGFGASMASMPHHVRCRRMAKLGSYEALRPMIEQEKGGFVSPFRRSEPSNTLINGSNPSRMAMSAFDRGTAIAPPHQNCQAR